MNMAFLRTLEAAIGIMVISFLLFYLIKYGYRTNLASQIEVDYNIYDDITLRGCMMAKELNLSCINTTIKRYINGFCYRFYVVNNSNLDQTSSYRDQNKDNKDIKVFPIFYYINSSFYRELLIYVYKC